MKKTAILFSFIAALSFLSGCNGGKNVTSISASLVNQERTFEVGDSISKEDIIVTATYSDSTSESVTDWTCNEFKDNQYTFKADDVTDGKTFNISYSEKETSVKVERIYHSFKITATAPSKEYRAGETINKSEIKVYVLIDDLAPYEVTTFEIEEFNGKDTYTFTYDDGDKELKTFHINFYSKSTTCDVKVYSYYKIFIKSSDHCKAQISIDEAKLGEEVTVYALADSGYALKDIKINGELQKNPFSDGFSHTFAMPKEHVAIEIITEQTPVILDYSFYKLTYGYFTSSIELHASTTGQTEDTYSWTSSDTNIVNVTNGLITPLKVREESENLVKITATSEKTQKTATCIIDIVDNTTYGLTFAKIDDSKASVSKGSDFSKIGKVLFVPSYVQFDTVNYEVNKIVDYGFANLTNIIYAFVPRKITTISAWAFDCCKSLKYVYLDEDVNFIGKTTSWREPHAFSSCGSLEEINVSDNNKTYNSKDGVLYKNNYSELVLCPPSNNPTNGVLKIHENTTIVRDFRVPVAGREISMSIGNKYIKEIQYGDKLTEIGFNCFVNCTNLEKLTPITENNITTYNEYGFSNCVSLKSFTFGSKTKLICNYAFSRAKNLTEFNYLGTKEQWKNNITKKEDWNYGINASVVNCSDGEVVIEKNN